MKNTLNQRGSGLGGRLDQPEERRHPCDDGRRARARRTSSSTSPSRGAGRRARRSRPSSSSSRSGRASTRTARVHVRALRTSAATDPRRERSGRSRPTATRTRATTIHGGDARSDNTVYARLTLDVGPENVAETARQMGIRTKLEPVASIGLGSNSVSVLEMASAYATLAAGGIYSEPMAIRKVVLPSGKVDTDGGWGEPKRKRVHLGRRGLRGDADPPGERERRHGHRRGLRRAGHRGQDGDDGQLRGRLVRRLHAARLHGGLGRLSERADRDDERARDHGRGRHLPRHDLEPVHVLGVRQPPTLHRLAASRRIPVVWQPFQGEFEYVPPPPPPPQGAAEEGQEGREAGRRRRTSRSHHRRLRRPARPLRRGRAAAHRLRPATGKAPLGARGARSRPAATRSGWPSRAKPARSWPGGLCLVLVAAAAATGWPSSSPLVPEHDAPDGGWAWVYLVLAAAAFAAYIGGLWLLARARTSPTAAAVAVAIADPAGSARRPRASLDGRLHVLGLRPDRRGSRRRIRTSTSRSTYPDDPAFPLMGAQWRDTTSVYGPGLLPRLRGTCGGRGHVPGRRRVDVQGARGGGDDRAHAARGPPRGPPRVSPLRSSAGTRCSRSTSPAEATTTPG